jgi:hypothetical protein
VHVCHDPWPWGRAPLRPTIAVRGRKRVRAEWVTREWRAPMPISPNGVVRRCPNGQIRGCLVLELKFNQHCSTFVLFNKKIQILD